MEGKKSGGMVQDSLGCSCLHWIKALKEGIQRQKLSHLEDATSPKNPNPGEKADQQIIGQRREDKNLVEEAPESQRNK